MADVGKTEKTYHPSSDSGGQRKPKSRWFVTTLVLLACLFATAMFYRNWIRAQWWAMQLANTENRVEQTYFANSMAAVGQSSLGATRRLTRHERPAVRALAIHILDRLPGDNATREIERLLADEDLTVRDSAALAMSFRASAPSGNTILPRLIATARSEDTNAATAATAALERIPHPEAFKALCIVAREHDAAAVRAQAVESLATWLRSTPEHLQWPPNTPSEPCDPFVTLVEALADSGAFTGRLSLERQLDAITIQTGTAQAATAQAVTPQATDRTHNINEMQSKKTMKTPPTNELPRTVAHIAAKALTRLTGEPIPPELVAPENALTKPQRADLSKRYRRLASLHKQPPLPDIEQVLPKALPPGTTPE